MTRYPYTCEKAAAGVWTLHQMLHQHGVLNTQPFEGAVVGAITRCQSCRGNSNPRRCLGWTIELNRSLAVVLAHAKVNDRLVRAEIQTQADYRRRAPAVEADWKARPLGESTVTVELFSVADERLIGRQHLDLANTGQPGPVWHLQSGGNPAGELQLELDWLNVPRWSSLPGDLVLVADALIFNLHYSRWEEMQRDGGWVRLVKEAEDLVMSSYVARLSSHFQRTAEDRDTTWLHAQDNLGRWDPRPSAS